MKSNGWLGTDGCARMAVFCLLEFWYVPSTRSSWSTWKVSETTKNIIFKRHRKVGVYSTCICNFREQLLIFLAQRHVLKINGSRMLLLLTEYWENITKVSKMNRLLNNLNEKGSVRTQIWMNHLHRFTNIFRFLATNHAASVDYI